jgi:DNA-binding beta-propeller fold protein YncE
MKTLLCCAAAIAFATSGLAQSGPYQVLKTAKVGGEGGFDYVYADSAGRRLYIARSGNGARVTVFNLDTLASEGDIADTSAHGVAVSDKTHHGFASSKPVAMWDTKTLKPIKTIVVDGSPDGIMHDPFNDRIYVFSHRAPNATVINPSDGSVVGTIDLGGAPEQAASDDKGHIYVDLEDKDSIGVVDARSMKLTTTYDIAGKGGGCAGLAMDQKNRILFATCRNPQNMVILGADDGKVITTLPIGAGTDGAAFNPKTMEAFSSQRDGTLTIVKEKSPTDFEVEQTVKTITMGKTLTLDSKTGHILIIGAEFGPPPAAPAAPEKGGRGRGGRAPMIPDSFSILMVGK